MEWSKKSKCLLYSVSSILAAMVAIFPNASLAATKSGGARLSPYIATEYYSWSEATAGNGNLLSESGPRQVLGLKYTNFNNRYEGVLLGIDMNIYRGTVAYKGNAFDLGSGQSQLTPFNSTTHYFGKIVQLNAGYRVPVRGNTFYRAFDLLFSVGHDSWDRDISGGTDADGISVIGYQERYQSIYAKAAIGFLFHTATQRHHIVVGLKRPLTIETNIDFSQFNTQVALSPKPGISAFATWDIYPIIPQSSSFAVSAYLEQTKFERSNYSEFSFKNNGLSQSATIYQPQSESLALGLRASWEFN